MIVGDTDSSGMHTSSVHCDLLGNRVGIPELDDIVWMVAQLWLTAACKLYDPWPLNSDPSDP